MFKCSNIILNLIKYTIFGICILYTIEQNKETMYYIQRGGIIGVCMIFVEYIIENICRDIRENFTTSSDISDISDISEENLEKIIDEEDKNLEKIVDQEEKLVDEDLEPKQIIEYGYSFVHPDAMKLPEVRLPKCIQEKECSVCPVMIGGTSDLMQVKPRKKPIAGCE